MTQWRVRDVMTPEVITVPAHASVAEIAAVLAEHRISGVPIVDRFDVVVGVVSWKDLHNRIETAEPDADGRRRWRRQSAPARWAVAAAVEVMSAAPVTVGPDVTLAAAGRLMYQQGHSRLLVVDDRHQLLGIVTRTDLLKVHARLDAVIENEVRRVLRRILTIQPDDVRVTVDDGVVTLSGRAARRTTALAAVALAEAVPGVAGVVDHLAFATDDTADELAPTPAAPDPLHGWWPTLRPDRSVVDGVVSSDSAARLPCPDTTRRGVPDDDRSTGAGDGAGAFNRSKRAWRRNPPTVPVQPPDERVGRRRRLGCTIVSSQRPTAELVTAHCDTRRRPVRAEPAATVGVAGASRLSPPAERFTMPINPVRLNHAVLFVTDLERSVRFYTEVFAMTVVTREPRVNAVFLRLPRSGNHHDLGLFGAGPHAAPKRRGGIGLYHLAWQVDTIDELAQAREALQAADAYTGESSHGATKSVYGADPDRNEFEVMWMLPRDQWGVYEHQAPIDALDLATELNRWSGVRTAGQVVTDAGPDAEPR